MSVLKRGIFGAARGLGASLSRFGGEDRAQRLRRAELLLEEQRRELERLRREVSGAERRIKPENVVWIFGTARTGSTWLASMMEELEGYAVWREPYVGFLFGRFYYNWVGARHFETKHLILGGRQKAGWLRSIRNFVLEEANARFPEVADGGYLIVKEPNGSIGAPLMMEALPESRMIFLVRDPRDVAASSLDANRKGSWLHERRIEEGGRRTATFDMREDALVENTATRYLRNVGNSKEAYEAHEGPKVLVRYEDLRADAVGTMKRMYAALGIAVDEDALARAVEKHSWERVPEEKKGKGKFHRKAASGTWREDLTPAQAEAVARITEPLLRELYPDQDYRKKD